MKVLRKGKIAKIIDLDNTLEPPSVTVLMLDENHKVGTELKFLTPCSDSGSPFTVAQQKVR
jgi:hypothetical protein